MKVLGIETSTEVCSVGLWIDHETSYERSIVESRIHSEKLLTLIEHVLEIEKMVPKDIHAVAVSIGPGSFSGLRIGLSTAKGLCHALDIPLMAVPTMEALAYQALAEHNEFKRILIALDAKQGEYYTAHYSRSRGEIVESEPASIVDMGELASKIYSTPLTGSNSIDVVLTDQVKRLSSSLEKPTVLMDVKQFYSGRNIAARGKHLADVGKFFDLEHSEPLYLKDFVVRSMRKTGHCATT